MPDNPSPTIPGIRSRYIRSAYQYNPECGCLICDQHNGQLPNDHPESGHSFCYGREHVPPTRLRLDDAA